MKNEKYFKKISKNLLTIEKECAIITKSPQDDKHMGA